MYTNAADPDPVEGEKRRVIVTGGEHSGRDAIIDFGDLDRPGRTYRAIVLRGQVRDGLAIGDQCLLRYRGPSRRLALPARWAFVERTDGAHVDQDAEVEAMTAYAMMGATS